MRKARFVSIWLLIFGVLALFSAATIEGVTGVGAKKAYAATINSDNQLKHSRHVIEVADADDHGLMGRQLLCTVDDSQLQFLQSRYGANVKQVDINGTPTSFVTVSKQQGLNQHILKEILGETHCHIVKANNVFYLFFRDEVS